MQGVSCRNVWLAQGLYLFRKIILLTPALQIPFRLKLTKHGTSQTAWIKKQTDASGLRIQRPAASCGLAGDLAVAQKA